jgi:predicted ABC-type ATPase
MGEVLAVQQAANRLFRTRSELAPSPRRVHTATDVVHGLGLANADQQQIMRLVSSTNAEWTHKTQTQRIFLARGKITEALRAMKHIPSETRVELVKRATAYWRATQQTDYGKPPTVRYEARKAMHLVIPTERLQKAAGPFVGPRGGKWADPQHKVPWKERKPRAHGKAQRRKERHPSKQAPVTRRHWVDGVDHGMDHTQKLHKVGGQWNARKQQMIGGTYTKRRQQLHRVIHKRFLDHVPSVPKHQKPVALVTMGGPASGKSTLVSHILGEIRDFALVNPDDVKERLPEYKQGLEMGTQPDGTPISARDTAFLVHNESSDVAESIHAEAMRRRQNIILDGTGKSADKYIAKIRALKAAGYHVRVVMPHIDKQAALDRIDDRAVKTGRFVPTHIAGGAHDVIPGNFERIAREGHEWALFESRRPPRIVWQGEMGARDTVHDPRYVTEFQALGKRQRTTQAAEAKAKAKAERAQKSLSKAEFQALDKPPSLSMADMLKRIASYKGRVPDDDIPPRGDTPAPTDGIWWPVQDYEDEMRELLAKRQSTRKAFTIPAELFKAARPSARAKGQPAAGSHKYIERRPDGHGGWLYKYPGDTGWQSGRGKHEGSTVAHPGEHLDSHHKAFKPTVEKHPEGGFTLHAGEGVSSAFKPGMSLDDHQKAWDQHKQHHDKAKADGDHKTAAAHKHALKTHALAHNMKQERARERSGQAPPTPTPEEQAAEQAAQPSPEQPEGKGFMPGEREAAQAAEGQQPQPEGPQAPLEGAPPPTGESEALQGGRTRHTEPHPDIQALQEHLGRATKVMSDIVGNHAHTAELKGRIKAVKADKALPRSVRKRLIAQHEAEIAASKADMALLEEHHDSVMADIKAAQKAFDKPHPILAALLKIFEKLRGSKADKDTAEAADKGVQPDSQEHRRTAAEATAEHEAQAQQPTEPQGPAKPDLANPETAGKHFANPRERQLARAGQWSAPAAKSMLAATQKAENVLKKAYSADIIQSGPRLVIGRKKLERAGLVASSGTRARANAPEWAHRDVLGAVSVTAPFIVRK